MLGAELAGFGLPGKKEFVAFCKVLGSTGDGLSCEYWRCISANNSFFNFAGN